MSDKLNCLYITSVFPSLSETFILREMQALASLGWNISIFRIRGADKLGVGHASFCNFFVLPVMLQPVRWFRGLIWAFTRRRAEFRTIQDELSSIKADIWVRIKFLFLLLTVLGMAEYIERNRIAVAHMRAHFLHNETVAVYWLSKMLHIPYSITVHTTMIYYPPALLQKVAQNASFCVGISDETVALATRLRGSQDGVSLIRNGVDFDVLRRSMDDTRISDVPLILAVGRLIPKKGFDVLVKACALLRQENINFVCRIVGNGSEFARLKRLIVDNHLSEHVHLVGALSFTDVVREYENATLCVMPSRVCKDDVDGLPTVIIEALAMRVPVIASSVAGIPDLVKDQQTGLIVPPEDEKRLADAIKILFSEENLCDILALQGNDEVLRNFNIIKTSKQLNDAILSSLVKKRCSG